RGNKYDAIIMDPPSYGRGPKGETWKIEENVYPLIVKAARLLSKEPLFFLINSYTTGLQPAVLSYMLNTAIALERGGRVESSEIGIRVSGTDLILPCGACGRWTP
nr:SAM-dependent methyltransferase [Lachnospiraceae bacterium]